MSKLIEKMTGYKATDKNMQCRGFQFELGKWYEIEGSPIICEHGFHFCPQPSGPWAFYNDPGTRIFKVEAEEVLDLPVGPGADNKYVCRRIRLVEELVISGNGNTGDLNTGNRNTGNGNTGDRNTGDLNTGNRNTGNGNTGNWNTGNRNTGNWNTGDGNTGNQNTGIWNTGDRNTGNWNTGDRNTGIWNTGDRNTGNWNTGDGNTGNQNTGIWNTGDGNATDFCSGFFCAIPQPVLCFDKTVDGLTREEFIEKYGCQIRELCSELSKDDPIDAGKYSDLPNWSEEAVKNLHETHKDRRKK